jgi:hypothetical protein
MVIVLNHHTPKDELIRILNKSFNRQLELKSILSQKINSTRGGEQLSWIKKYNSLFIHQWGYKKK